jgi:cytochrome c551/c552
MTLNTTPVIIALAIFTMVFFSCNTNDIKDYTVNIEALSIVQKNCTSCHHPNEQNSIAPSLKDIHAFYNNKFSSQNKGHLKLFSFLSSPKDETAMMKDAVKKYGLMPKISLSDEELKAVAELLYGFNFSKENWDKNIASIKKESDENSDSINYLEKGKELASATKGVLGKNLLTAINTFGTEGAIEFCNTRAIPITDSMSTALNATIKRVSDKARNSNNNANEQELAYIKEAKKSLEKGEKIKPKMTELKDNVVCYYPIETATMCLQCHGEQNTQIKTSTLNKLTKLYPQDKATGYKENELRGIWVVEMVK